MSAGELSEHFISYHATRISPPMPERKVIEGWVNVYDRWEGKIESWGALHPSKEAADKFAAKGSPDRIACVPIRIEYTEGEGL